MPKPSGIYCPACLHQGIESELTAQPSGHVCPLQGHKYPDYGMLMSMKPKMRPLVVREKQPEGTIILQVWTYPGVQQALQARFPANLMTTLSALLTALADGDTFIVEGEHVRELKEAGIECRSGRDVVGLANTNRQFKQSVEEAQMQQKVLAPLMKLLAAAGGQNQQEPYEDSAEVPGETMVRGIPKPQPSRQF